ncbi:MAG: hypothetical protein WAO52_08520 [Prolixibacteraceae bacterium]
MSTKLKSILAHLTPLGWLIALVLNSRTKDQITSFYLRQTLGVFFCFLITRFIPDYFVVAWGFIFVFWVFSFVGATKATENLIPFIGSYFQKWFKLIS